MLLTLIILSRSSTTYNLCPDGVLIVLTLSVLAHALIAWSDVEEVYAANFTSEKGPKTISPRAAFGALIIQVKLSLTDDGSFLLY